MRHLPGRPAGLPAVAAAPLVAARLAHLVHHPPRPGRCRTPADAGLTATELHVGVPGRRASGRTLHAWLFTGDPGRVVVLGHALGREKSAVLPHARFLADAGYTVVAFDFRNHGRSFDDRALSGYSDRFAADLAAVVGRVRSLPEHAEARIALYGMSLSAFAVLHTIPRVAPVDAVVCDSGPAADLPATVRNLLRSGLPPIPGPLRSGAARTLLEAVFASLAAAAIRVPRPWPPDPRVPAYRDTAMLFLAGGRDALIDPGQVRALAARYPRSTLVELPRAGHLRTMAADPERYQGAVIDFLAEHLGRAEVAAP